MSQLWPQLPYGHALERFALVSESTESAVVASSSHPSQTFSATGGSRVLESHVEKLATELEELAVAFGFPAPPSPDARIAFDRRAASVIVRHMDLSWSEASNRDVWSFLALVPLSKLTLWRFGTGNRERWLASDLTRHTWSRLWWHGTVFKGHEALLARLSESDLNQLLERRVIGGNARLTVALASAIVFRADDGEGRRSLMRDATARLRRRLAFTDTMAMGAEDLAGLCREVVDESIAALTIAQPVRSPALV